ncbi:MAG TPA: peptidase S9 [Planctomycetaceae bacterium]|nr:peptidase S9 [Planctomycetaceae bacterium]
MTMHAIARFARIAPIVLIVAVHLLSTTNTAQAAGDDWRPEATRRLKAIYEKDEFKVQPYRVDWLPDSSGYKVREVDRKTKRSVVALYDVRTSERTVVEQSKEITRLSPDGTTVVETVGRDLFLRQFESGERTRLVTGPAERAIVYRDVHWSPDGTHVSFVEVDRTDVRKRSVLVPSDPSYPGVVERRFARVGETIESLRVGIVSTDGGRVTWAPIETPDEGFYLGQVNWTGDELLIETVSRFRDKREFWLASVAGKMTRITGETNDAWAIGSHQINLGARWIRHGKAFIYISEKDGWRRPWLCSRDGSKDVKLMSGEFDLIDRAHVDEDGGWYYFYASPENATQKYLFRLPLDASGTAEQITPEDQKGTHEYRISPDSKWAIHTYSTVNTPPIVELVKLPGHEVVRVLKDHEELRAKMKRLVPHPTEFVQIDVGDGVVMDASVTKPRNFDPQKKYPVFVYVYGEPYLQTVLDRWGAAQIDFHRVVADTGYVVVSIDNRGTAAPKGAAWRRSIFGSLGPLSTEDQAAALKELARMRAYVDLSRVGIWGWSGGGSNTLNAMFRRPDIYHVGIAVVPKPQPHLYNAWFQEIYMRTREVNAQGYERSAPINFAEGLKGKLLIVTGSGETNTHIQIIEGLVDRLIELGKPFDYMVYPNRDHGLREGPGSVVHVRLLILRYLIDNLPRGPR